MIDKKELDNKSWLIAVSGGADSMCLLDLCYQQGISIVVGHVNYQKRESANRDMQGVQEYCAKRNIPCFVMKVTSYDTSNFQAQARKIRYDFFARILQQEQLDGVLVAHHQDDVLETYMMQKQRNMEVDYYGIKKEVVFEGMLVKRVLLSYSKAQLIAYCESHKVVYYEDESNFENTYTRNKVRNEVIAFMSVEEKESMLAKVDADNLQNNMQNEVVAKLLKGAKNGIDKSAYMKLDKTIQRLLLRKWIAQTCDIYTLSKRQIEEIHRQITHKNTNFKHNINGVGFLMSEYGVLKVALQEQIEYTYIVEDAMPFTCPYCSIAMQGEVIEKCSVNASDFPLTIRNAKAGDAIRLRHGTKKVSRFFIDRKVSKEERQKWPVVTNKYGKVIFVCGIGCDIAYFSNNYDLFVLK